MSVHQVEYHQHLNSFFEIRNVIMNYPYAFPVCGVRCQIWNSLMLKFADDELLNIAEEEDESIDVICHSSSIKARLALCSVIGRVSINL